MPRNPKYLHIYVAGGSRKNRMNVGKKSKMYDEESKTLPVTFVQQIMQHLSLIHI